MYLPPYHAQPDTAVLRALIDAHPLGAWVCQSRDGLVANHIPFLLDRSRGAAGTLLGHVSRANPVWLQLEAGAQSVVLFQGPQSYITPGWYPSRLEHGKVVPTWNYAVAHVHGVARAVDDKDWLRDMLTRLTAANEASMKMPWKVTDAPGDFIDRLLGAVVGIEIPIDRIVGKLKVSQDEALQDRLGTAEGLAAQRTEKAKALAVLVQLALAADD